MPGALAYDGLDASALEALSGLRSFVEREVIPAAKALDAADEYPEEIVAGLASWAYSASRSRASWAAAGTAYAYCLAVEELARGWMSVAGILNTHFIVCAMLQRFSTEEQRAACSPASRPASWRRFSMTEPHCGSDVQAIRTQPCATATSGS